MADDKEINFIKQTLIRRYFGRGMDADAISKKMGLPKQTVNLYKSGDSSNGSRSSQPSKQPAPTKEAYVAKIDGLDTYFVAGEARIRKSDLNFLNSQEKKGLELLLTKISKQSLIKQKVIRLRHQGVTDMSEHFSKEDVLSANSYSTHYSNGDFDENLFDL